MKRQTSNGTFEIIGHYNDWDVSDDGAKAATLAERLVADKLADDILEAYATIDWQAQPELTPEQEAADKQVQTLIWDAIESVTKSYWRQPQNGHVVEITIDRLREDA